jgi:pyruvate dehydrogenase E2 component (dihydrolipoamide acetyltransferase)
VEGGLNAKAPAVAPSSSAPAAASPSASSYPTHNVVGLPALSPTMDTGNVGTWKKNVGDQVVAGDILVDVETDKAQMDFECQEEGYLAKILVPSGTKDVKVGQVCVSFQML